MDKVILHCDLNNFYASVEQLNNPEYAGLPLAVSGNPKLRHGIILAKNQIAKECGVKTGEALWISKQKCPDIVFVPPHFELYVQFSKQVFEIYTRFTDKVERFGIDECWLDVTGSTGLFGTGKEIADTIRETVKAETGLTISVGVSFTKVLAKLGSDLKKPDATTVLSHDNYMDIIGDMSPNEFIMIGKKTAQKLEKLNINTIRELAGADSNLLRQHFGIIGENMICSAQGIEQGEVKNYYDSHIPKSVSNGTTTPKNMDTYEDTEVVIYTLAELVCVRLRKFNMVANGVSLSIKNTLLQSSSKQAHLSHSTSNALDISHACLELLRSMHNFSEPLRAVTVGAISLENADITQISLFDTNSEKDKSLDQSLDKIRQRYGYQSVKRGITLKSDYKLNLHEEDDFEPFMK